MISKEESEKRARALVEEWLPGSNEHNTASNRLRGLIAQALMEASKVRSVECPEVHEVDGSFSEWHLEIEKKHPDLLNKYLKDPHRMFEIGYLRGYLEAQSLNAVADLKSRWPSEFIEAANQLQIICRRILADWTKGQDCYGLRKAVEEMSRLFPEEGR